jgi:hypothetical protein
VITLMFIFAPLGFMALVLLLVIALCRIAKDADEWREDRYYRHAVEGLHEEALRAHADAVEVYRKRPCRETQLNAMHGHYTLQLAEALVTKDYATARRVNLQIEDVRRTIIAEAGEMSPEHQALVAKAAMN